MLRWVLTSDSRRILDYYHLLILVYFPRRTLNLERRVTRLRLPCGIQTSHAQRQRPLQRLCQHHLKTQTPTGNSSQRNNGRQCETFTIQSILIPNSWMQLKNKTAGPGWFDLPAPAEADLPRLHREVDALRLRNQLDPKRFYRKDDGEGKGIKGLPKHFAVRVRISRPAVPFPRSANFLFCQIGTILPTTTPFGTASTDNLPRAHRKRNLVDELVDDAEARRYAKRKFDELQSVRGARGKKTLHKKNALRKPKW